MSEYWKSIPRKYCDLCKTWYQDNKPSQKFHEQGLKHQANVKKHLSQLRRDGAQKDKEQQKHNMLMKKIERDAMAAYEKDLVAAGKQPSAAMSQAKGADVKSEESDQDNLTEDQYGSTIVQDNAKKNALELVSKNLSKRLEWYESKTVEGKVYYYNRATYETIWKAPKCGYVSLNEQKTLGISDIPGDQSVNTVEKKTFKHEQYGKWQTVTNVEDTGHADLQLPERCSIGLKRSAPKEPEPEVEFEFGEKTIQSSGDKSKSASKFEFKKRKNTNVSRNMRQRIDD